VHWTALVESPDHVCCRYRMAAFSSHFQRAGHSLTIQVLPRRWWSRLWLSRSLRGANVILQRRLLPAWEVALLRRTVKHLLFDFDDAVFLRDSYSPRGHDHPGRLRRFRATVQACDAVIAGNAFLADHAARWTLPDSVHVIPTCVHPGLYEPRSPNQENARPPQLVWIGSSSTLKGLQAITPLLEEIGKQVPGLQLKIICDRFIRLQNMPVVECPWKQATEAPDIGSGDIGISWVPDDPWSRGKCGLKVLQYMAAGLPVVANPVGVHPEMIRPGENGYLATSPNQWVDAIRRLASDASLRQKMGQLGRHRLENEYSVEAGGQRWLGVLDRFQRGAARTG
jgi:glycosyltransferase involved in cell wall biosynthesis